MTDKNKSLNLLIEKERNEANEQLLIENKDLKQRISSLLAYISSLESKLNNLYHKEEKEVKNTVKIIPSSVNMEEFKKEWEKMIKTKPSQLIHFEDDEEVECRGCTQMSLEQIRRANLLNYGSLPILPTYSSGFNPTISKNGIEEK